MALSKSDEKIIRKIIKDEIGEKFTSLQDGLLGLTSELGDLKEELDLTKKKIDLLPTKEEFFSKMDEAIGELKTTREEQQAINHRLADHEDRITALEETSLH